MVTRRMFTLQVKMTMTPYLGQVEKYRSMPDIFTTPYFFRKKACKILFPRLRHEFVTTLAWVGRSNDPLVAAEAPKCKIDTILCRLGDIANVNPKSIRVQSPYADESNENATTLLDCKSRIRRCLPLIETDSGGKPNIQTQGSLLGSLPECQCAELTLSDGTEGDCQSGLLAIVTRNFFSRRTFFI